jgi:hypothetical protein
VDICGCVWLKKICVSAAHLLSSLLRLVKKRITVVHLLEKSVIKYDLSECLLPVFDWSIIMIGPGGLLLVVPTYLQSPAFSFMCGGCRKVNN